MKNSFAKMRCMMKCPRTGEELIAIKVGSITVDVSPGCGGVFFDNYELEHFDEKTEKDGEILLDKLSEYERVVLNEHERINCPKCVDVVMARRYYSPQKVLEIDECPQCGGIWLFVLAKILGTAIVCSILVMLYEFRARQALVAAGGVASFQMMLLCYLAFGSV